LFIELAEILICPACRLEGEEDSLSGLVAVVKELHDRRVMEGWLGCPACKTRYPVVDGAVRFGLTLSPISLEGSELGFRAAALLAVHERPGYVLVGQGLDSIAGELAGFAAGSEVVVLAAGGAAETGAVNRLIGVADDGLPFRPGSVSGAALLDATQDSLGEAARVLQPAGRLVVLRPKRMHVAGEVDAMLRAAGFEPFAVEAEAVVAIRSP
jgi:uncharacterized protein YbaR (Trm112 family)